MKTKTVTLTGLQPLIMCREALDFEERLNAWRKNPCNASLSVKGDGRSPAWTWIGCLYSDGEHVGMPSDNIMAVLREGGAKVPTGKRGGSYKRQSQSGLIVMTPFLEFRTAAGNKIPMSKIAHLYEELEFGKHVDVAKSLGIELFIKRVKVGSSKWVSVRPMFAPGWTIEGQISIMDAAITDRVFSDILLMAGTQCGLGAWRPSAPKGPGPFGTFEAKIK